MSFLYSQALTMTDNETKQPADDGGLTALVMQCAFAVLSGQQTVTIAATGKRPVGFPRGELLSAGSNGSHNYACNPVKVLTWAHARTSKTPNVKPKGRQQREEL